MNVITTERLPRILYLTGPNHDFLADSLLHGLRGLLGTRVVDYPRCRYLYESLDSLTKRKMHGRGFTLYGRLSDSEGDAVDRECVWDRVKSGDFDLVVFSSIWQQHELLRAKWRLLSRSSTVLIDGEDRAVFFPWFGMVIRQGLFATATAAFACLGMHRFVRERPDDSARILCLNKPETGVVNAISRVAFRAFPPQQIAFSVPEEHVASSVPEKRRLMFEHIVDPEVCRVFEGCWVAPMFSSETEYFGALRRSRFAITRKRAGWECLRHYEIAASGCVPCFRFLDKKPPACAPFGLDASNCIAFSDPPELRDRITSMSDSEYQRLASGALAWASRNTTSVRAREFLAQLGWLL